MAYLSLMHVARALLFSWSIYYLKINKILSFALLVPHYACQPWQGDAVKAYSSLPTRNNMACRVGFY